MSKGFTLWFTGLSGSGKSTLAERMLAEFRERRLKVEILDGDVIRTNLSKGLGFSKEDRDTNIRRVGFVADLLTRNEVICICACISPYRSIRDENRALIGRFVEVWTKCPIEVCEQRDVKGLYAKARAGALKGFTGIDDPYEEPAAAEVVCETDRESVDESVAKIFAAIRRLGYL
ncbi:MAG: adenylyl-sulfate kinase [Planctomycetes bacterium]|jgi:adenylylsulfate kinase|nr:adenylyl-sulfate kinase [Planctomycetota bacterium]